MLAVLFLLSLNFHGSFGKYVQGVLRSSDNWVFLTRFCFLSDSGFMRYEFKYPVKYGTENILLYFDTPGQWYSVYKRTMSCRQKENVLSIDSNQILALNTSYSSIAKYSGCVYERDDKDEVWYLCRGQRDFRSTRERWWFIVVSRCSRSPSGVDNLYLEYKLHLTNGDSLIHKEFSADEFYILPLDIVFLVIYFVIIALSIFFAVLLRKKNMFHSTYKLYMASVCVWTLGLVFLVSGYGSQSATGWEKSSLKVTGRIVQAISSAIFVLMLILMAKGYTITRGRLSKTTSIKITAFIMLYGLLSIAMFIWEAKIFDPGLVLYYYESPAGFGMTFVQLLAWFWFLWSMSFTMKHNTTKANFFMRFFSFYTFWFWAAPIMSLIAMIGMPKWSREKTVHGVEQFIGLMGHLFFLWLTKPSRANKNFPYTVKSTQISASKPETKNEVSNMYTITTREAFESTGPNLDMFITSKSVQDSGGDGDLMMYIPLDQDTDQHNDVEELHMEGSNRGQGEGFGLSQDLGINETTFTKISNSKVLKTSFSSVHNNRFTDILLKKEKEQPLDKN